MGVQWISFPGLLRCWAVGLLLALALDRLYRLEPRRPRSMLPLAAAPALLWLQPLLPRLAQQCQMVLLGTVPGQFLQHTFNLPLS